MVVSHTDTQRRRHFSGLNKAPCTDGDVPHSHTHTRRHFSGLNKAPCTNGGVPHTHTQTFFRTHQSAVYRWWCPTQTHIHADIFSGLTKAPCTDGGVPHRHTHADIFQDSPKRRVQMAVSHNSQACTSYPHWTRNLTHDCIQTRDCFRSGSSLVRMSRPQIPRCLAQSRCEARLGVLHGKTERLRHTWPNMVTSIQDHWGTHDQIWLQAYRITEAHMTKYGYKHTGPRRHTRPNMVTSIQDHGGTHDQIWLQA